MSESDAKQIEAVMSRFLRAVSFESGEHPTYGELRPLFTPHAKLARTSRAEPEISSVEDFIHARQRAVDAGELTSFNETELSQKTELFGNVAHRFSVYAKRGTTHRGAIAARGAISTQFIRVGGVWRISAMAWDDEREGLVLPDLGSTACHLRALE